MTVCIVSHCFRAKCFVSVTDSMLSMSDISADRLAIKSFSVGSSWLCLFAANDMSPVIAIRNAVRAEQYGKVSLTNLISAFQSAFRKELVAKAETTILAPFGMNMAEFRQNGLANFGSDIFSRIFYQIEQMSLDVTFLIFGFHGGEPHIFSIQNKGEVSHFDQPGFWAIGSGQTSALGSLFNVRPPALPFHSLEEVVYHTCKAKFVSESAPGVGNFTFVNVLEENDSYRFFMSDAEVDALRQVWKTHTPVDVPAPAKEAARKMLKIGRQQAKKRALKEQRKEQRKSKQLASGKSEQEQ